MENYVKLNDEGIVIEMLQTSKEVGKEYMNVEYKTFENIQLGYKWNGKEFEEVPQKDDPKAITMEDLNKKLDLIISHLGIKGEDPEEKE